MTERPTDTARPTTPGTPGPQGSDGRGEPEVAVYHCDLCGNAMLDLHCKLVCERCGYKRDCSDP